MPADSIDEKGLLQSILVKGLEDGTIESYLGSVANGLISSHNKNNHEHGFHRLQLLSNHHDSRND
jgi:hypothetical protein